MTLFWQILGGALALALGVYLGMPGRSDGGGPLFGRWFGGKDGDRIGEHSERRLQELERALGNEWGQSRKAKRHFTLFGWLRKDPRGSHQRRSRRYFRTAAPTRSGRIRRR